jgi:hypothetical protein
VPIATTVTIGATLGILIGATLRMNALMAAWAQVRLPNFR